MQIVNDNISLEELKKMASKTFGNLVKAVVDVEKRIMAIDAPLHSDQELLLLESGSEQKNLWGINLYPEEFENADWIEFDSMINIRPSWGNKTRSVDDTKTQQAIIKIVNKLVAP